MKSLFVAAFVLLVAACAWSAMVGGLREITDLEDSGLKNALSFAVSKHNHGTNNMYRSDVMEVVRAQSQVVAGMKYLITAKMGKTNCRKEREETGCGLIEAHYQCNFTVWSRPWMKEISLEKQDCGETVTSPTHDTAN